jgi:Leucine-rich repeat (LRR) protein
MKKRILAMVVAVSTVIQAITAVNALEACKHGFVFDDVCHISGINQDGVSSCGHCFNEFSFWEKGITDEILVEMIASGEIPKNTASLGLSWNKITDISPLESLTELRWLFLSDNNISDLTPLSELTNLRILNIAGNEITDVTPLGGLINLNNLQLGDNRRRISDFTPLKNLKNLGTLNLDGTRISENEVSELRAALRPRCVIWADGGFIIGHVLGNQNISINDAIEILKFLARLPNALSNEHNLNPIKAARITVTLPARPSINCALEILKHLAKLPSLLDDRFITS